MTAALLAATLALLLGARLRPLAAPRTPLVTNASSRSQARRTLSRPTLLRRSRPVTAGEVAGWCDDLARATRSGTTLSNAIREVARPRSCAAVVERVVLALDRGAPLREALDAARSTSPHVDLALVVLRACAENGGPPSEPIDRAASALRAREADAADRRTQSAQARLSALVMTVLPGAMLGVLLLTSGAVRGAVASPAGVALVTAGALLNLLGWRWMNGIVNGGRP